MIMCCVEYGSGGGDDGGCSGVMTFFHIVMMDFIIAMVVIAINIKINIKSISEQHIFFINHRFIIFFFNIIKIFKGFNLLSYLMMSGGIVGIVGIVVSISSFLGVVVDAGVDEYYLDDCHCLMTSIVEHY